MKNIFLSILMCLSALTTNAQSKLSGYLSYSLSMTNTSNFRTSSYTNLEGGVIKDNLSLGVALGRGSMFGMFKSTDSFDNYFYEFKTSAYIPMGIVSIGAIVGYGGYFNTNHTFIEYGGGLSYTVKQIGYGVSITNWDGITYLSPSLTFNF
jgi:hypothetical protein